MGKKIFIADDDTNFVKLITVLLKSRGFEVVSASDGEESLRRIPEEKPSLAIVDLRLPKVDGWHLCQRLKSNQETKHIPLIVLSGLVDREGEKDRMDQGDFYFSKPFEAEELVNKIRELLGEKKPDA